MFRFLREGSIPVIRKKSFYEIRRNNDVLILENEVQFSGIVAFLLCLSEILLQQFCHLRACFSVFFLRQILKQFSCPFYLLRTDCRVLGHSISSLGKHAASIQEISSYIQFGHCTRRVLRGGFFVAGWGLCYTTTPSCQKADALWTPGPLGASLLAVQRQKT